MYYSGVIIRHAKKAVKKRTIFKSTCIYHQNNTERMKPVQAPEASISLFPILLVNFIGTMGFSIVLPFLIVIVLGLGGNSITYGALGACYSFFQLIGAPVLGKWSDHVGRRKILLLSSAGTLVAWLIFLLGLHLPNIPFHIMPGNPYVLSIPLVLIFVGRSVDGLTGGNISVANAYLADISTKANRKAHFGKMSASANMGLIVGPLLAGLLGNTALGSQLPVMAAALISLISCIVIYYGLHDVQPKPVVSAADTQGLLNPDHKDCFASKPAPALGFRDILRMPYVTYFLVLYFLIFLAFNFYYVAFPVHAAGVLHWSVLQLGIYYAVMSGLLVLIQGPVLSWLAKRCSGAMLVICGSVLLAAGFFLFRYSSDVLIYTGVVFFAAGNGIMWPSFIALLSNTGDANTQGAIQGIASSAGSLASIIGLLTGALLYHTLGANTFLLACGFMLLIGLVSVRLIKAEQQLQ